ncbi:MAG: polynucleotide kinase-phosphatase [Myxococcota bacterium]
MELVVPELSLVLMIGASGSGKSTFAAKHFAPSEVLSSDHYRAVVSNDETAQDASADAFEVLELIASKRLERGLLTVIDATNVDKTYRARWLRLARQYHVLPIAIVLELPPALCHARNADRQNRRFGAHVTRRQCAQLRRSVGGLRREGFRYVHRLKDESAIAEATVHRPRPWTDRRDDEGPFDIIGDVHGCFDELFELLRTLGYAIESTGDLDGVGYRVTAPEGRRALFLGDLVDRGPASDRVLHLAMDMVDAGVALCIPGNHEAKLKRHLEGRKVKLTHGLEQTKEQLEGRSEAFRTRVHAFIDGLISHFVLDQGRLIVAHAGMREELAGRASGRVRQFALYGETTGEIDEFGLPVRATWADDYRGAASVVYGHTPVVQSQWHNRTLCIDTGCVFGGALTALRWPERDLVSVEAKATYYEPIRPPRDVVASPGPSLIQLPELLQGGSVRTRFGRSVRIPPAHAPTALETLSRFTVDPRWLIHLPPTMAPCETSGEEGFLEHPAQAFAAFASRGVTRVVCEEKHMGSRALVIVGRNLDVLAKRFGFAPGEIEQPGIVLTRRGRRFFAMAEVEAAMLAIVDAAMREAGLYESLETDWALWDCELMPWSAKAQALLEAQYAPVGTAARSTLAAAVKALEGVSGAEALLSAAHSRKQDAEAYTAAYRRYCWPVKTVDDHRLAPFHLLATEGAVHHDRSHAWHLDVVQRLVEASASPVLQATDRRWLDLDDAAARDQATQWWLDRTDAGSEGMVVKPEHFLTTNAKGPVQPAIKCRGREYLRIIYGPEYTRPEHLKRLRQRGVGRKQSLAMREFLLGLEALHRFVERRSLHDVHACIFALLALESEPVDPRL